MIHSVQFLHCLADDAGQRLDNFLSARYKTVPKSRIYRAIRKGEVRVNKSRAKQTLRLAVGDVVRVPPMAVFESVPMLGDVENPSPDVIYQDDNYMIVNKPPGVPVHSGSKFHRGVIDAICACYGDSLRLVHRLDKDVSGCLVVAKNRQSLLSLQRLWSTNAVKKIYHAVVFYDEFPEFTQIDTDLKTESGRMQSAKTEFVVLDRHSSFLLLEVHLHTGRKHQIRRHLSSVGLPIIGDKRYGDFTRNRRFASVLPKSIGLHARKITLDIDGLTQTSVADYPHNLASFIRDQFSG